jgi:hypothetical protein
VLILQDVRCKRLYEILKSNVNIKIYQKNLCIIGGSWRAILSIYASKHKISDKDIEGLEVDSNSLIGFLKQIETLTPALLIKKYGIETPIKAVSTLLPKEIGMSQNGNKEIVNIFKTKKLCGNS